MATKAASPSKLVRVFLVEDNPGDSEWIRTILIDEGLPVFTFECAPTLSDALKALKINEADVLLLDLMLPDSVHLKSLERLQEVVPEIPIILLTNLADEEIAATALQRGAQDYLVKGRFDRDLLTRTIRYAIERHRYKTELDKASRMKDEFLAVLSHELRTPLTPMLGWIRMLRSGKLDSAAVARGLEVVERNVKAQGQLIEDLLDLSRIISGKFRLNLQTVEMIPLIQAAVDTVRPAALVKNVELEANLNPQSGVISGDPDRLQQVVWNLLSNAIKFTGPKGHVRIYFEDAGYQVQLKVCDDGEGIDPQFLPMLFNRFSQEDIGITRTHGGLGLGLSIVRHIVSQHGGSIHAESPGKGKGATFIVKLPISSSLKQLKSNDSFCRVIKNREAAPMLSGAHILVVDDEPDAREFLVMALAQWGAQVTAVASAREGIEALIKYSPDVMISDIGMPELDGFSLIRQIRALPTSNGRIPAVALTAYARAEDRQRVLAEGYQVHIPKPVEPADLALVVATLIRQKSKSI